MRRQFRLATVMVALLASGNFLFGIGSPHGAIWDESYYLTSTQRYEEGVAQFASHPPLGLMLIAAGDAALRANSSIDTTALGREKRVDGSVIPAGFSYTGVRLASGVFAVLGAVLFFALMFALTEAIVPALVFSNLFTFENAFQGQFRAAHLDAFQVTFAIAALLSFVLGVQRRSRSSPWLELGLGMACGLAVMVKVNAIILLLLCLMHVGWRVVVDWREAAPRLLTWNVIRQSVVICGGFASAIVTVFVVHMLVSSRLADPAGGAAQKDATFISADYRQYLEGQRPLSVAVAWSAAR